MNIPSAFVISLDFELFWGIRDIWTLQSHRQQLLESRRAVTALLQLFEKHDIHATWAIVGFMFFANRDDLLNSLPDSLPNYKDVDLSPYPYLNEMEGGVDSDLLHFAPSLVAMVAATPHQEVGSHTFSHYYCLEEGQDSASFKADLEAAKRAAQRLSIDLESIVFPRNQIAPEYLSICEELGFKAFRGNEDSWLYRPIRVKERSLIRRGIRLVDAYVNLSGHHCHDMQGIWSRPLSNVPSSRFLRPYSTKLRAFEPLRLRRILSGLDEAAKSRRLYHLWWHPHNFGRDLNENLAFLNRILEHYRDLQEEYGMLSLNMREVAALPSLLR